MTTTTERPLSLPTPEACGISLGDFDTAFHEALTFLTQTTAVSLGLGVGILGRTGPVARVEMNRFHRQRGKEGGPPLGCESLRRTLYRSIERLKWAFSITNDESLIEYESCADNGRINPEDLLLLPLSLRRDACQREQTAFLTFVPGFRMGPPGQAPNKTAYQNSTRNREYRVDLIDAAARDGAKEIRTRLMCVETPQSGGKESQCGEASNDSVTTSISHLLRARRLALAVAASIQSFIDKTDGIHYCMENKCAEWRHFLSECQNSLNCVAEARPDTERAPCRVLAEHEGHGGRDSESSSIRHSSFSCMIETSSTYVCDVKSPTGGPRPKGAEKKTSQRSAQLDGTEETLLVPRPDNGAATRLFREISRTLKARRTQEQDLRAQIGEGGDKYGERKRLRR